MKNIITAQTVYNDCPKTFDCELPNKCPYCGKSCLPKVLSATYIEKHRIYTYNLDVHYICPNCENTFIGKYTANNINNNNNQTSFCGVSPHLMQVSEPPFELQELSPDFFDVYVQSAQAENAGLLKVAGIGYRLSLEFLVKDYAMHFNPENVKEIKDKTVGQCIEDYIEHQNLKEVAKRALWLGNDHAHYVSKHPDKDLPDLKELISLTMQWVVLELGTEKAKAIPRA